jgi:hypothetical protein
MKKLAPITALACLALAFLIPNFAAAAPARASWVWSTGNIRGDASQQAAFFQFLAAPHGDASHAITTVFFDGMDIKSFQDPATVAGLKQFMIAAHAKGIKVDFLCGDPSWATPAGQAEGTTLLSAILTYNHGSPPNARYDGFQYDVEPYTLPGWPSTDIENGLLALFDASNTLIHASGQHLKLAASIPRWFGNPDLNGLDRKIIDRTDEIDVMDYVSNADHLVSDPADILDYASKMHKAVWIGVETGPLPDTPRTTFYGVGNAAMEAVLSTALPSLEAQPSFRGYAIHHWATYQSLKP